MMPVAFRGMDSLEDLFRAVVPRRRPERWRLPIIGLCGDPNNVAATLTTVKEALDRTLTVRCKKLDQLPPQPVVDQEPDDPVLLLESRLLEQRRLVHTLVRLLNDAVGLMPALRFRRYRLVEWLMSQYLTEADEEKELAGKLRHNFPELNQDLLTDITPLIGPVVRIVLIVVWRLLPKVIFRIRVFGRWPIGVYGWVMRQPLAQQSRNLVGFGRRITGGVRRRMDSDKRDEFYDELEELLVNAFLEDLRAEYRWRPFRIWRRTYPVVLLDRIDVEGVVARFVNRVDAIRQKYRDDPLLIVVNAVDMDTLARPVHADRAKHTYENWAAHLPVQPGQRGGSTWLLWVKVPATWPTDEDRPEHFAIVTVPPQPPVWWVRWSRFAAGFMVLVLVVCLGIAGTWTWKVVTSPDPPCHIAEDNQWSQVAVGTSGECIGFSAEDPEDPGNGGHGYLFGRRAGQKTQWLTAAQKAVYQQNRRAEAEAGQPNARPLVTLVYFGQLSDMESYVPEREDLEGLLLAQQDALGPEKSSDLSSPRPLVRLVLANAGRNFVDGNRVVSMLAPLMSREHSLVGALGMDVSRRETETTIHSLAIRGIPVIGTTLSADELANSSPTYFQLSAPDRDIAAMIKNYLDSEPRFTGRKVRIYRLDDPDDLYTNDTAEDLNAALGRKYSTGIRSWDVPGTFADSCSDVIFYAGRDLQFNEFLRKLQAGCPNRNVTLMADDSVNRFMDSTALRAQAPANKQSLIYVAKASLVACNYPGTQNSVAADNIFRQLAEQHGQCLEANPRGKDEIGERTVLSYDAVQLYMDAVQSLLPRTANMPVGALSVWGGLRSLQMAPQLAGGMLNYSLPADPTQRTVARIPNNKWRGLLQVDNINDQPAADHRKMIYGCGQIAPTGPFSEGQCRRNPFDESTP